MLCRKKSHTWMSYCTPYAAHPHMTKTQIFLVTQWKVWLKESRREIIKCNPSLPPTHLYSHVHIVYSVEYFGHLYFPNSTLDNGSTVYLGTKQSRTRRTWRDNTITGLSIEPTSFFLWGKIAMFSPRPMTNSHICNRSSRGWQSLFTLCHTSVLVKDIGPFKGPMSVMLVYEHLFVSC